MKMTPMNVELALFKLETSPITGNDWNNTSLNDMQVDNVRVLPKRWEHIPTHTHKQSC